MRIPGTTGGVSNVVLDDHSMTLCRSPGYVPKANLAIFASLSGRDFRHEEL